MATPLTSNSLKLSTPKVSDAWKNAMSGYGINSQSGLMYRKTTPTTTTAKTSAVTASPAATGTAAPVVAKPASQPTQISNVSDTLGAISARLQQLQKESSSKKDKTKSNYVDTLMGQPKTQDYYAAARGAMDEYIKSLMPSDAEKKTQGDLDAIGASLATGLQTAGEQAIPMGFITGQQQSIENRAINRTIPLEAQLKRLQTDRTATSEGAFAKYGLETSLADAAREDARYQEEKAAAASAAAADLEMQKAKLEYEMGKPLVVGEGSTIYDPSTGQVLYKAPKTYAPSSSSGGEPGSLVGGDANLRTQPGYASLNAKQKTQADSLNNLVRSLNEYKTTYEQNKGAFGGVAGNMAGADAGLLATKLNSILFAAAQAEGTGALQQADREVLEQVIPNPTSLSGALGTLFRGGAQGNIDRITDQINKYTANLASLGLTPTAASTAAAGGSKILVSKTGQQFDASALTPAEYAEAIADGYKPL